MREGWDIFRADRLSRYGSGVAIYVKQSFTATDNFTISTDMCEAIGLYFPLSNTVIVTIYRPPNCELDDFAKVINKSSEWISSIECKYKKTPTVIINGDFNFPKMKSWSSTEILSFLDNINDRETKDLHIGTVPKQTKILCDLIQDLYLHQVIEGSTRKSNLLDLFFCSDIDTIVNHEVIENILFIMQSV